MIRTARAVLLAAALLIWGAASLSAQVTPDSLNYRASLIQGATTGQITWAERALEANAAGDTAAVGAALRQLRGRARAALTMIAQLRQQIVVLEIPPPEPPPVTSVLPAFPGAVGAGSAALADCRSLPLAVHKVRTAADLERVINGGLQPGFYNIVTHVLGGRLEIGDLRPASGRASCVYWTGATAPTSVQLTGGRIRWDRPGSDLVIRGLAFRKGDLMAIHVAGGFNRAVIDSFSGSWTGISGAGGANVITLGQESSNITVQNCLLAEPSTHPTILHADAQNFTVFRCLSSNGHRTPALTGRSVTGGEIVQNIAYNWIDSALGLAQVGQADIAGNLFIPGPGTARSGYKSYPIGYRSLCDDFTPAECVPSLYVEANSGPYFAPDDQWGAVICDFSGPICTLGQPLARTYRRTTPRIYGPVPASRGPMTAELREHILDNAGASWGVACDGTWYSRRDAVDARIVNEVRTGTGLTTYLKLSSADPDQPPYIVPRPPVGAECADSDGDGLPDAWEARHGISDPAQLTPSGYLAIEHYLNGTDPQAALAEVLAGGGAPFPDLGQGAEPPAPSPAIDVWVEPGQSINDAVAAAAEGTRIGVRAGVYRLTAPLVPRNRIHLIGEPGAVLSGARPLSFANWTPENGSRWWTPQSVAVSQIHGECDPAFPRCGHAQELFIDGLRQRHVGTLAEVREGSWFFDRSTNRVYVGTNPAGRTIELSAIPRAFQGAGVDVVVRGLTIQYIANLAQSGAIHAQDGVGWVIEDNVIEDVHGVGIRVGNRAKVRGNKILRAGQLGVGGIGDDVLFEGNEIAYSNAAGFSWGWEAGGTKFVRTHRLIARGNYSHDNLGPGLWLDIDNFGCLVEGNRVEDNHAVGIYQEIGYDCLIRNNEVRRNGHGFSSWGFGGGIVISASGCPQTPPAGYTPRFVGSRQVCIEVSGNVVEDNGDGIVAIQQNRGTGVYGPWLVRGLWVHGNTVRQGRDGQAAGIYRDILDADVIDPVVNLFDANTYLVDTSSRTLTGSWFEIGALRSWSQWQAAGFDRAGTLQAQ